MKIRRLELAKVEVQAYRGTPWAWLMPVSNRELPNVGNPADCAAAQLKASLDRLISTPALPFSHGRARRSVLNPLSSQLFLILILSFFISFSFWSFSTHFAHHQATVRHQ